jgi:hypothetical protein
MDESRRKFLKDAGCAALSAGCGFPLLSTACSASGQEETRPASSSSQWAMVVDIRRCLDEEVRRACTEACHREHNVPDIPDPGDEVKWIWSEEYQNVFPDQVHAHTATATREAPVLVL